MYAYWGNACYKSLIQVRTYVQIYSQYLGVFRYIRHIHIIQSFFLLRVFSDTVLVLGETVLSSTCLINVAKFFDRTFSITIIGRVNSQYLSETITTLLFNTHGSLRILKMKHCQNYYYTNELNYLYKMVITYNNHQSFLLVFLFIILEKTEF